jgi:hypothetical protein
VKSRRARPIDCAAWPLLQRAPVRRLLFVLYCVGTLVAVLNLFLAGTQLLGLLSGLLAATTGSVLYYSEET